MNTARRMLLVLLLASLLMIAAATGQNSQPPADSKPAVEQDHGDPLVPPEDGDGTDDEDGTAMESKPVTGSEEPPVEAPATEATMERFKPTEKISEDNSVAFPNDI